MSVFTKVSSEFIVLIIFYPFYIKFNFCGGCVCRPWPTGLHWHSTPGSGESPCWGERLTGAESAICPRLWLVSWPQPGLWLVARDWAEREPGWEQPWSPELREAEVRSELGIHQTTANSRYICHGLFSKRLSKKRQDLLNEQTKFQRYQIQWRQIRQSKWKDCWQSSYNMFWRHTPIANFTN